MEALAASALPLTRFIGAVAVFTELFLYAFHSELLSLERLPRSKRPRNDNVKAFFVTNE